MTITDPDAYARAVVRVLREHTSWLPSAVDAEIVTECIERQVRDPQDSFEVIVDDPAAAKWRLHADNRDRRRVLLYIHRDRPSEADAELSRTVNDALRALDG